VLASSLRLAAQARHVAKHTAKLPTFANDGGKRKTGSFRNNLASFAAIRTGNRA
jgi:hypothetical protein